jgi:hypothetical protein
MGRKPSRAEGSRHRFKRRKQAACTEQDRLAVVWDRIRTVLTALAKADPRLAEEARRDLANQLEPIASDIEATTDRIRQGTS